MEICKLQHPFFLFPAGISPGQSVPLPGRLPSASLQKPGKIRRPLTQVRVSGIIHRHDPVLPGGYHDLAGAAAPGKGIQLRLFDLPEVPEAAVAALDLLYQPPGQEFPPKVKLPGIGGGSHQIFARPGLPQHPQPHLTDL